MKTINTYSTYNLLALLLLIGLIIVSTGCKDDDNDDNPHPPLSYFSCKVNGEKFETRGQPFGGCNGYRVTFYEEALFDYEPGFLSFGGSYCPSPGRHVVVRGEGILSENIFDLTDSAMYASYVDYRMYNDSDGHKFNSVLSGTLTISELRPRARRPDGSKKSEYGWIEGTFEFEVTNEARDTIVHVTEGRFGFRLQ